MAQRATATADRWEFSRSTEPFRRELLAHCYRMLGSMDDAEDLVQETYLRAWRSFDSFEGRSSLRTWLYQIASNACLTAMERRARRPLPSGLGSPDEDVIVPPGAAESDVLWLQPIPDELVRPERGDPAAIAVSRESLRLALIASFQYLPPRQRAVLILREVLRWQAAEVAELLGTSVASVNSALQRARATLSARDADAPVPDVAAGDQRALLARYVDAFERYDITSLVSLLHDEAVMSMPPYNFWLRGPAEISRWQLGPGIGCRGSRLVATAANGCAAYGSYRRDEQGGHRPWAIQVIEISGARIVGNHNFVDASLFPAFGLPARLP